VQELSALAEAPGSRLLLLCLANRLDLVHQLRKLGRPLCVSPAGSVDVNCSE
jgi:hypothetical protein